MAVINDEGNITARCAGCAGALTSFSWRGIEKGGYGVLNKLEPYKGTGDKWSVDHRLFKCSGCGGGALGVVRFKNLAASGISYPGVERQLIRFMPEVTEKLPLPEGLPKGLIFEFREAEACMDARCYRAAAGLFRSVLDKTLRANGYKLKNGTTLEQQIELAAKDGVITSARARKAHEDIRVLGNDVLHDEWHEVPLEDVEAARHYAQRILEDLYDDRATILKVLRDAGRLTDEDKAATSAASDTSEPEQQPA